MGPCEIYTKSGANTLQYSAGEDLPGGTASLAASFVRLAVGSPAARPACFTSSKMVVRPNRCAYVLLLIFPPAYLLPPF